MSKWPKKTTKDGHGDSNPTGGQITDGSALTKKGIPAEKMSKSYDEYWHEPQPTGAANMGANHASASKPATHGHTYPGRPYPEKGTRTGLPKQDTGKVVPELDMETVEDSSIE